MLKIFSTRSGLYLIVAIGLLISSGLFLYVLRLDRAANQSRFYEIAYPRLAAVKANISTAIDTVVMLGGHFSVEPPIQTSRAQFTVLATKSWQRHPYVQALAGVAHIGRADRAKIEKLIESRDDHPGFRFTERGPDGKMQVDSDREDYFPVLYEVPKIGNEPAFGYNLGSDPVKVPALEKARDTGDVISTPRVKLVQGKGDQYGVLLFNPVYSKTDVPTVEERRSRFVGYAMGVFRIGDLISLTGQTSDSDVGEHSQASLPIDVHVYDMSAAEDSRQLFPKAPEVSLSSLMNGLNASSSVEMGGREWKIIVTPNERFSNPMITLNAFMVFLAGFLATIGFSLYIKRGQERAVNEALYSANQQLEFHQAELEVRTAELAKANVAANVANTAKSEFLSSMSHELRTPLHAIIGFSELLMNSRNANFSDKHRSQITQINKAGEYLFYLINEILEFTKIEAGVVLINVENVSLRSLLDDCVDLSGPVMAKYGVTLVDETAKMLPVLRIDPVRGRQIFLNLLSNAAKYNKMGGTVRLTCTQIDDRMARISVIDTGNGIDESKMSELFMPFSRLGAELTAIEGSGIGLALVRKLVDMMGGTVTCHSVVGQGSTFSVDMPLAQVQIPDLDGSANTGTDAVAVDVRDRNKARDLLYIEDNPANASLMQDFIANFEGWSLVVANDAETGIAFAQDKAFDLIICDINLPGMNGLEAIHHLKRTGPNGSLTPILALSADATPNTIEQGKQAGFTDYLTKPIRLRELERIMLSVFRNG